MSTTAADHKVDRIRAVPMFASASASTLELLAQSTDEVTVQPGKVLVTEGHLSHDAYVIESGTAEVLVDGEVVAEIPAGELIGELAFLDPGPSTATVRAQTRMDVLVIPHNRLDAIVAASPEIAVIKAIQQEIRQDVEALAVEQKVTGDKVSEVDRKLDRLLFIVEQNGDPSR